MVWTITMTQAELNRKTIIEQALDKRISQKEGAAKPFKKSMNCLGGYKLDNQGVSQP